MDRTRPWPVMAVCLYALLIPFQPVLRMPDGEPLRFAAADAVAPLIFLGALVRPARRLPSGLWLLAAAIPALALLSTLLAAREHALSSYAIGKTAGLFYVVGLSLAAARCLPRGSELTVLRALAAGALWSAVIGLVGFAAWLHGIPTSLMQYDRLCSTMTDDPNIYGGLLAVGLLVTVADTERSPASRLARALVIGSALVLTGSRSGLVGGLIGLVFYSFVRQRDPWIATGRAAYGFVAAVAGGAAILTTDPGWHTAMAFWDRVSRLFSIDSRFRLYERALEQFSEHPIFGLGVGGFWDSNTWYESGLVFHSAVHNTYLWALVDLGVAGGILVAALFAAGIGRCVRVGRLLAYDSAAMVAGALVIMATFNLFIDGLYQRHLWVLMACALGMPALRWHSS
jgi:O-antigen ligase